MLARINSKNKKEFSRRRERCKRKRRGILLMIRLSSKFRCSGLSSKKPPAFSTGGWKRHYWVLPETPSYNKKGRLQKGKGKQTTTTTTTKKRNAVSATFASSSVAQRKRRSTVQPHKNALTRAVRSARKKKKTDFSAPFLLLLSPLRAATPASYHRHGKTH